MTSEVDEWGSQANHFFEVFLRATSLHELDILARISDRFLYAVAFDLEF